MRKNAVPPNNPYSLFAFPRDFRRHDPFRPPARRPASRTAGSRRGHGLRPRRRSQWRRRHLFRSGPFQRPSARKQLHAGFPSGTDAFPSRARREGVRDHEYAHFHLRAGGRPLLPGPPECRRRGRGHRAGHRTCPLPDGMGKAGSRHEAGTARLHPDDAFLSGRAGIRLRIPGPEAGRPGPGTEPEGNRAMRTAYGHTPGSICSRGALRGLLRPVPYIGKPGPAQRQQGGMRAGLPPALFPGCSRQSRSPGRTALPAQPPGPVRH